MPNPNKPFHLLSDSQREEMDKNFRDALLEVFRQPVSDTWSPYQMREAMFNLAREGETQDSESPNRYSSMEDSNLKPSTVIAGGGLPVDFIGKKRLINDSTPVFEMGHVYTPLCEDDGFSPHHTIRQQLEDFSMAYDGVPESAIVVHDTNGRGPVIISNKNTKEAIFRNFYHPLEPVSTIRHIPVYENKGDPYAAVDLSDSSFLGRDVEINYSTVGGDLSKMAGLASCKVGVMHSDKPLNKNAKRNKRKAQKAARRKSR